MRGKWQMRDWEKDFWKSALEKRIAELKTGIVDTIDLTDEDLCPENVIDTLEILGYEYDDVDMNGWEQDTWITFTNAENHGVTLFYCGRTFEMKLYLTEEEEFV